jgi:hypothetical protein
MEHVAEIIRDLLIFVAAMMAIFVLFIVVVSMMPHDNPLKRLLTALTYRIGATAVAGLVAIPIEPIPVIDALFDIGVPIALIWYWFTFLRDAGGMMRSPHGSQAGPSRYGSITKSDDAHRGPPEYSQSLGDEPPRRVQRGTIDVGPD